MVGFLKLSYDYRTFMPSITLEPIIKNVLITFALFIFTVAGSFTHAADYNKGSTLFLLSNLHPDISKNVLYTMNYQLPSLIPICSEITVISKSKKRFTFSLEGREYIMVYDKHSKKAGVAFNTVLDFYFGSRCDKEKIKGMSGVDQKGIRKGIPYVGMTREGIVYAMGRPPIHVNPKLNSNTFMYWLNRFKRQAIDFDDNGLVEEIRL